MRHDPQSRSAFAVFWLLILTLGAAQCVSVASAHANPVLAVFDAEPTGDTAGTLDAAFTHTELATIRNQVPHLRTVGGLTPDMLRLLTRRLQAPPVPVTPVLAHATGAGAAPHSVEHWRPLVATYFAPSDIDRALNTIWCESRGNSNAKNPNSSASGLWQHLATYWTDRSNRAGIPGASIWDPEASTIVAAWLVYSNGGWGHWPNCGKA